MWNLIHFYTKKIFDKNLVIFVLCVSQTDSAGDLFKLCAS